MQLTSFPVLLAATAQLASAHFGIEYPPMRFNTLGSSARNTSYSQWINPCANVPGNLTNAPRTDWPLTGGSVVLDLHHPWTYLFINLGLGANAANFNYTLTDPFLNVTGNGTFCIPKLNLPANLPVSDGSLGSLQVVTVGEDGNALYNCADITFRTSAGQLEGDKCKSSEGVSAEEVKEQPAPSAGSTLSGNRMGLLMGVMGAVAVVVGLA